MDVEKVSEIIAHFIGLFDTQTDEMRLRQQYLDGQLPREAHAAPADPADPQLPFSSDLDPKDYDPHLSYNPPQDNYDQFQIRLADRTFAESLQKLAALAHTDLPQQIDAQPLTDYTFPSFHEGDYGGFVRPLAENSVLSPDVGPGSEVTHLLQANAVRDDDILDMTDGHHAVQNLTYLHEQLGELVAKAADLSPFQTWVRTENPDDITRLDNDVHQAAQAANQDVDTLPDGTGQSSYHVTQSIDMNGHEPTIFIVDGTNIDSLPQLEDYLPDRGLAKPHEDPVGTDTPQHIEGSSGNSLDVEAGANFVANVATIVDTNIVAPVMAVMGDFHSANAISQVYVYSDHDKIDGLIDNSANSATSAQTIGTNIAVYAHSQLDVTNADSTDAEGHARMPSAWHVSVIDGDVSFVHWTEQYNFLSDNDSMTVTTQGVDTTVLTGGNSVMNLSSFLGIGEQYDLVIVGGSTYNLNAITQISVLYDNDHVNLGGSAGDVQTGGNLLWNLASIETVGDPSRFAAMPDYISDTIKSIQDKDSDIPTGLAHDANFAGYHGLNVLYITGNFFDVNVLKQVNIVGDADSVNKVASNVLSDNSDAVVKVDTGSNALVNIASIVDYNSGAHTTYVAGNVYSDAVLIQGGIIEHGVTDGTGQSATQLAPEAIAFLGDHDPTGLSSDHDPTTIGHDTSSHVGAVGDVMQSITA